MRHEGPLPSEALPVGEDPLTPEELDRVATAMFEAEEIHIKYHGQLIQEEISPENWTFIQEMRADAQNETFEYFKQIVIKQRKA